jgi:putative PIN family toxin of toxin-antitoxin system
VGAVIRAGIPRRALYLACDRDAVAMSQSVWDELVEVLNRPRLARFVDAAQREVVLELLRSVYVWFEPRQRITDCRDAKDNKYLELALASEATTMVSSDDDLLTLHPWRGIHIVRPAAYLQSGFPNR